MSIHKLSTHLSVRTLRSHLYLMQMLVGEWELALSFSVKRQTLRDFINGNKPTPPPRLTAQRLEEIVRHHIRYQLPSDPAHRLAQLKLLGTIYPHLLPTTPTGTLSTSSKRSQTLTLVRDYIIDQRNKGKQITPQQVVEHFQSPAWLRAYGYPIKEHTIRSNIRRALGKWPELAEVIIPAKRGRRAGSKLKTYGDKHVR